MTEPAPAEAGRSRGPSDSPAPASGATSRYELYVSLTATAGFALATMDSSFFTAALTPISRELGLSPKSIGLLTVVIYVVAGLATYGVGLFMDTFGRRRAFQFTLLGTATGTVLTALSTAFAPLVVFRAVSQAAGSAEGVTGQTLVAENASPGRRGFLMAVQQVGYPIGWFLSAGLALIIIPTLGWRALFVLGLLPALLVLLSRRWIRESDRFTDVARLRRRARGPGGDPAAAPDPSTVETRYSVDRAKATRSLVRQLFDPSLRRTTTVLFLATFFFALGSGTVLFFIPYLVEARGYSNSALNQIIAIGTLGGLLGYLLLGYLGDRVGRKWLIVVSLLIGALGILALSQSTSYVALVAFEIVFWVFYMGAYAALYGFLTESYPTRVRGTGTGFVTSAVWIGNAVCGGVFTVLLEHVGVAGVFVIGGFCAGLVSALLFCLARPVPPGSELEAVAR